MRALAVCDGEHYAPVVRDALAALPYEVVGLWLAGGGEKLREGAAYGVPAVSSLEAAIAELEPEVVVDLSDEPVLGPRERLRVASRVLALGLPYVGPDFRFDPPELAPFPRPSLSVIGTGKRVGKTAVTPRRTTSRRPRWRASSRSAAVAAAAGSRARRASRTCSRGRRWPPSASRTS